MTKATVVLEGMSFTAYHGCLEKERRDGNTFIVDLSFEYDASAAARSDSLDDAVDYGAVYDIVAREMALPSNLLENVAWRIREAVSSAFPAVSNLRVSVAKQNPPVNGPAVSSKVIL